MKKPELIIFTGNIGCGKSTLATRLARQRCVIINSDAITSMVQGGDYGAYDPEKKPIYHAIERAGITTALFNNFSVVVDRTNMKVSDRARYIDMGKSHDTLIRSYCWGAGDPVGLERRLEDPKGIPEKQWRGVFDYMAGTYEKPGREEGFDSIHFIDLDGMVIDEKDDFDFSHADGCSCFICRRRRKGDDEKTSPAT